ncbi:hypothetical protein IQ279_25610 [Streptomyces verrucosisporus]|uniref:hypothetical protein n=1 Tax=Streptomyces verrucosisporus TaxID=1695161 RepID=UPI0019D1290D|nr:hypothetical protein [Streptomyces verrucosisporus]MBN3932942.1 hypothetical protein [Streptomyces verrucosisporus]
MTDTAPRVRFLVLHDYGMGGLWWWVWARSAREVAERLAEVEVVDDPEAVERAGAWDLEEADVDAPVLPGGLGELRDRRDAQRGRPGFGALADRAVVMEAEGDGRRLRQVELTGDGTALRSGPEDWIFNPPVVDLFDPGLPEKEIGREEFEAQWRRARHDESYL